MIGRSLGDIIASGSLPVVRLTEVFWQAAEAKIIVNAHRINQGQTPDLATADNGDFYFVNAADAEEGVRKLLAIDLVYLDLGGTTVELIAYEGAAVDPAPQAQERRSAIRTGTASSLENGSVNEGCC